MYKKIICLMMIVVFIFPLFPSIGESTGYVKEIDVGLNGMKIEVEGTQILNQKNSFLYEDEIWVPLKDLARGLNLKTKYNEKKKSINLDSKGALNIDISKATTSYQNGYEIDAKEKRIDELEDKIDIIEKGRSFRIDSSHVKDIKVKNIKVYFGDVAIYLDGKRLNLDIEPFIYDDDVYVPVNILSPYLYITPSYKEDKNVLYIDANGILVKNKKYSSIDNLVTFRESRNYLLGIQLEQLEKRKETVENLKIPYKKLNNLKDLEKYLNTHLNKVGDLSVDIRVGGSSTKWLYLDISFPYSRVSKWYKLQRIDVENWIWDMYIAIISLYNEDAFIYGAIENPYYNKYSNSSNKNYVTFDTIEKDLYFDFSKSNLKKDYKVDPLYLAERLEKNLGKYNKVEFDYECKMSGDDMYLTVYSNSKDFINWYLYAKMGYLKKLNWEVKNVYPDLEINGKIVFPDEKYEPIRFNLKDNKIRSVDLLRETEEFLNTQYGSFSYGRNNFYLKYSLYEKGLDDFNLTVEGDFAVTDDAWINAGKTGEERLYNKVQNAISYCMSLWNRNISTEVVDKNLETLKEIDIYRNTVGIICASPSEGEIKEGTNVYLYTNTPGARIFYTVDGSTPNTGSTLYTSPITVTRDIEINAFGYKEGYGSGPISTFKYTVKKGES